MKPLPEHMAFYAAYHRDARNRLTHFIGVPAIAFAILIPMSWLNIALGGLDISLAMAFTAAVLALYFVLDLALAVAMALFFLPLLGLAEWVGDKSSAFGWTVFGLLFVGGWIAQLIGHVFEGRRPALVDNLFQILVAPIFLMAEAAFALGYRRALREEVERLVPQHAPGANDGIKAEGS
jgi:uncharacterized membrane protein YGL010W